MEDKKTNIATLAAVALASIAVAVGVTLAVTSGDDDDDADDAPNIAQSSTPTNEVADEAPTDTQPVINEDQGNTADPVVDADDQPFSEAEANRVSKAALNIAGGGTVTDLDRSDDPGEAWEVEVTFDNGSELDVALDENLNRVQNTSYDD